MTTTLTPSRFVTIEVAEMVTGYSASAIRSKIARGDWVLNKQYRKAPDDRVLVDLEGYEKWVLGKG